MNDDMLSQEEIDALLNINKDDDNRENDTGNSYDLSTMEMDALGEIGNISFGSSATTLSTLLNQKVEITTPSVNVIKKEDIEEGFTFEPVSIQVNYLKGFTGNNVFVIKAHDVAVIADIMLGGNGTNPPEELNEIHLSAVQEAMNQMMGAAATSMSTIFDKKIDISPPSILVGTEGNLDVKEIFNEDAYIQVFFKLTVGDLIDSNMMQLIPMEFGKNMVNQLLNDQENKQSTVQEQKEQAGGQEKNAPAALEQVSEEEQSRTIPGAMPGAAAYKDEQTPVKSQSERKEPQYLGNEAGKKSTIQQASFSNFEKVELDNSNQRNLDMLLDIPLKVTVELGQTKRKVKDILDLSSGSIIELDKLAGEPVDILVNGKLIAEGEVVVIDENFGVRVTDIISMSDRIMKLK